jgi:hypothetical protein
VVVGPFPLGDPGKPGAEDVDDLPGDLGLDLGLADTRGRLDQGIGVAAELPQEGSSGDTQQVCGGLSRLEGERFGVFVQGVAEAQAYGQYGEVVKAHGSLPLWTFGAGETAVGGQRVSRPVGPGKHARVVRPVLEVFA